MRRATLLMLSLVGCQSPQKDCPPPAAAPSPAPSATAASSGAQGAAPAPSPPSSAPPTAEPTSASGVTPSPLRSGNQVQTPSSLDEINRWATAAGVRDDLLRWVAQALRTEDTAAEVRLEYVGAESPLTAVATVTLDRYLDDSVRGERFLLKFSRKDCPTCASGKTGWWLWEMDVSRRCYAGRGHEDFSKAPCL